MAYCNPNPCIDKWDIEVSYPTFLLWLVFQSAIINVLMCFRLSGSSLCFSVVVIGLNDSMSGGMQLLPDPLFSIPTDNTYILSITSTDLGRIFMAGKDGCLYEIAYQAEAGWLSQRCRKINHSKSSLSFLVPSVLQFSFSEDGKERDTFLHVKDIHDLFKCLFNSWLPLFSTDPIVQIAIDNSRNTLFTRSEKGVLQVRRLINFMFLIRWWLSNLWAKKNVQFVCFLGVWPGRWWAGNESCGNYVTELYCCSCWKHSQVYLGSLNLNLFHILCQ